MVWMRMPGSFLERSLGSALVLIGASVSLASCSSSSLPPIATQSPVATTLSWFKAVNSHDMALAQEHFTQGSRQQMDWSSWGASVHPPSVSSPVRVCN